MATEQKILLDSTQTVSAYPPMLGLGKITGVTHLLRTPSTDFQAAAEAASYDTVDTTLDAAASEGATSLSVASATGITAGRTYLLGLAADATDNLAVEVASVVGTTVNLKDPLPQAVASADLFFGWQVSHALLAAETEQEGEGQVKWIATIGGETVTFDQQFRVVYAQVAYTLNGARLVSLMPITRSLQDPQDGTFQETIEAAWDAYLVPSIEKAGMKVQRITSWDRLEPWHATACVFHLMVNNPRTPEETLARWEQALVGARDDAIGSPDFWYDDTGEDETRDDEATTGRFGPYRRVVM
jgi:hypothetical protein